MARFDFVCKDCKEEFEKLVMGSEEVVCPQCESKDIVKQFSPPTILYKTGGFYSTDK